MRQMREWMSSGNISMTRFLLLLLSATAALAQTRADLPVEKLREVDRIVTSEMSRTGAPGVSVAVLMDGSVRYANGFGLADLENSVPATADTVYRLASISKPITATAVMQLVEQGRIELDAPLRRYVPGFPEKEWPVTIRQLLGHLGGIRSYLGDEMRSTRHYTDSISPLDIFQRDPLIAEPGTRYAYTTYGFNLLGAAVESASGMKFPEYLKRYIFEPAGMDRIRVDDVYAIIPHRAEGYHKRADGTLENSTLADTSNKIPGGGLCSTVWDLARFASAIMSGKLVRPETFEEMSTPQRTRDGTSTGYGYGFGISERDGFRFVTHGGGQPQVSTMLAMIPERRFAVVWMCNLEGSGMRIHIELAKALLP
jgi:CubicO group peptidase (beta-lactamase class C family)